MQALEAKLAAAPAHLDAARDDSLALTVFPARSGATTRYLNKEIRRRTDVVGIFPGREGIISKRDKKKLVMLD